MTGLRPIVERWRARRLLRDCEVAGGVRVAGGVLVEAAGTVAVGEGVELRGGTLPVELVSAPGARLEIGERTVLEAGCSIVAATSVRIGAGCTLGRRVRVRDATEAGRARVAIGDGAWIGHDAMIEPGVSIGPRAVVAAGAVVVADVPADATAAGNPARILAG